MKSKNQQYLTYVLRNFIKQAEFFFETDFSDIKITVGHEPGLIGAVAFAFGNEIYLSPDVFQLSNDDLYELLIHELTHVIQQRHGRVPPLVSWNSCPGNDNTVLEREACAMGRSFRTGQKCSMPYISDPARLQPVIQKIVSLGGIPLSATNELSTKANKILDLIPDGIEWLDWAISKSSSLYPFSDEYELLSGIQAGINGKQLLLLKKTSVLVTPVKLIELEVNDLKKLSDYENSDNSSSSKELEPQISEILSKNDLLAQKDIAKVTNFLTRLEVNDAPLFQALDLREKIDLVKLYDSLNQTDADEIIQRNAAKFALKHAMTPLSFSDYFLFYITIIQKSKISSETYLLQNSVVNGHLEGIIPFLFGMLRCPRVERRLEPDHLMQILQGWINYENQVGFSRLSTGALQVALNTSLSDPKKYQDEIVNYMAKAQIFIKNYKPDVVNVSQDGQITFYNYKSSSADAVLALSLTGNITLQSYTVKS